MKHALLTLTFTLAWALARVCTAEDVLELFDYQFESSPKPKIAIVIDDIGYQSESVQSLTQLPFPLTLAVIPFTPYADHAIASAQSAEQEVILHVPMETLSQRRWEEGLNTNMSYDEVKNELETMLERYPQAIGINNHGGSKFTANAEKMHWVMQSLSSRNLYFLDSRTTHESQAIQAAQQSDLAHATRDVFLDNIKSEEAIEEQFEALREIASKQGSAIAIGHPHPETIAVLKAQLPQLVREGFELTVCSELLEHPKPSFSALTAH